MSEVNFKNGSTLKILSYDPANNNVRGNRSKIIGSQCYDTETDQWIFREWNMDEPIDRYIPEFIFMDWIERENTKKMNKPIDFALVTPECGDWEALYADGKLIAEGHSLSARDVLDAISDVLPNIFRYLSVSDEKAEEGFTENLSDIF